MLHTNRALATEEVWTGTVGLSIVAITVCNILVQVSKLYLFGKTEPKALGSSQKFLKPQGRNWGGTQFACKHWPCKREDMSLIFRHSSPHSKAGLGGVSSCNPKTGEQRQVNPQDS